MAFGQTSVPLKTVGLRCQVAEAWAYLRLLTQIIRVFVVNGTLSNCDDEY
jgi:hypothetical protein